MPKRKRSTKHSTKKRRSRKSAAQAAPPPSDADRDVRDVEERDFDRPTGRESGYGQAPGAGA